MGDYNPHAPYILGNEWVPIRQANYVPDGVTERGYSFRIDHTSTPVSGAFYVAEIPDNVIAASVDMISVYPRGREALTGPVKVLHIPASAISVNNPGSIDDSGGVSALFNPEDTNVIIFNPDTGIFSQLRVNFDTNAYAEILLGKRIVDVRIRYSLSSFTLENAANFSINVRQPANGSNMTFPQIIEMTSTSAVSRISTLSITDINPFWDSSVLARGQRTALPWRFQELNRFRSGAPAADQLVVSIQNNAVTTAVFLGFLDLEVLYCEETRVLYGGFKTYDTQISNTPFIFPEFYNSGAIAVRLYNPVTLTQGNTLTPGDYTVTLYHRNMAALSRLQGAPLLYATREYYPLVNQSDVRINQTTIEGDAFALTENESVLTHLTLHTASTIVTGSHAYGISTGAPVFGTRTATQEIEDNPSGGIGVPYPQVRFYARRFGDTTVPLALTDVATGTSTVSITVEEFDELHEIVDGWKEVNLRFATPPTFPVTADDVDWRWTATNELAGNQWQVLVASGPTGSWNPNPTAAATGPATYWSPFGSNVTLTWQSPSVSGVAADTTSDAVLIFSQDPPAVTGFALEIETQELGQPLYCDSPPNCIPTGLSYVRASWSPFGLCDTFERDALMASWGQADSGQTYVLQGTASDFSVSDDVGKITASALNSDRIASATLGDTGVARRMRVNFSFDALPASGNMVAGGVIRMVDSANFYAFTAIISNTGTVSLQYRRRLAGALTTPVQVALSDVVIPGEFYTIEAFAVGGDLRARFSHHTTIQNAAWQIVTSDTSIILGSDAGVYARDQTAVASHTVSFDDINIVMLSAADGELEIQRRDAYASDWQTVLRSDQPGCVSQFLDLEARVGVFTQYRMRTLNALDFAGPWVTGSATIPSPGVLGAGDANSVLIFTSNHDTDASLAYVMQWEGQPIEEFAFPEADTVSLQRMFGRDFVIAVRPLERGGERFQRTILVNAAAISLPSMANFRGLRDLAWADLDYVCVRDELGNRWFATVIVPQGEVRGNRTIYLARIDVVEVTDEPSPVD